MYSPEDNPYVPGDPYSYDLKWLIGEVTNIITWIEGGAEIPRNISYFYNDVGYITLADLPIYDGGVG